MAQELINIGIQADDGTGDTIRNAGRKINANFTELFALDIVASDIRFEQNNIVSKSSNADIVLKPSGTGNILFPGITFEDNNIKATRSNDDLRIVASGSGKVVIDGVGISGTSISAVDSSSVNINENLRVEGALTVTGTATFDGTMQLDLTTLDITGETTVANLTVAGSSSYVGTSTIDNLTFNDNIISTSSNADLMLTPGGTGVVNVSNLTIDSSINLTDNVIKVTRSNDNLVLDTSGSGTVEITSGLTTAAVTTIGNVDITGTKTVAGQIDIEGIRIKDNTLSTKDSNANLEISGNGSGNVVMDDVDIGGGAIDNTVIGGTTPAAGTFTSLTFTNTSFDADGVTITDNTITANRSNDNLELEANGSGYVRINDVLNFPNSDGSVGQLLQTNGSGQLSWVTSPILFGVSSIQDTSQTISFSTLSEIDHVTATGAHNRIESTTVVQDSFATSKYDSAWYLAVNRDDASDEFEVTKHSVVHNNSDAFITTSIDAKTGTNNHVLTTVDVSSGSVRLLGTGSSPENSVSFYRIGLGDDDSTGYSGEDEAAVVINTDVDSASEVIDSFAHGSFRGAKYYISVNNASKTELSNIECSVVHDGTTAFISTYNIVNTGNNDLITLTAAINGSNVELSAAGLEPNLRVHAYRIMLADNEADRSSTNINVIGNVTVSSATTALDTFSTGTYQAAHYVIVAHNASEGHSSICEAAVVSDGTNAFVSQYGLNSTKGTDQILLTAAHDGSDTVTLSATSSSGGSTTVNAYRVNLARGAGTSSASATLDSVNASEIRSAKYNVQVVDATGGNYELFEANVTHDGSNANVSTFGNVGSSVGLITVTADIDSGNLRLLGTINNTNDHVVKVIRRGINV